MGCDESGSDDVVGYLAKVLVIFDCCFVMMERCD